MSTSAFYDTLSSYYHLIFPDWMASIERQGRTLNSIIRSEGGLHLHTVLDILTAFQQFHACTNPGGICLVSVRDYAAMDFSSQTQVHPYDVREVAGVRYVLLQVWDLKLPLYDTTFYIIEHREHSEAVVHATRATYYAVSIPILIQLMEQAKFQAVCRIDGRFLQPIIVGHKQ